MDITFNDTRFFLSNLKFDIGVDYATLYEEFQKETWTSWSNDSPVGHENPNWNLRYKLKVIQSPLLRSIKNYIDSDIVKQRAIDILYSYHPSFQGLWGMEKQQLSQWSSWHMEYMLDYPGFYLEPHNDYRRLIAAGMIYFNQSNDPAVATTFYHNRDLTDPLVLPNGIGTGWLAVNDYCNWHTGKNASNYNRYSALIALTINVPK
jgi:hypothetical protein